MVEQILAGPAQNQSDSGSNTPAGNAAQYFKRNVEKNFVKAALHRKKRIALNQHIIRG
jgi:hypothetical protein